MKLRKQIQCFGQFKGNSKIGGNKCNIRGKAKVLWNQINKACLEEMDN